MRYLGTTYGTFEVHPVYSIPNVNKNNLNKFHIHSPPPKPQYLHMNINVYIIASRTDSNKNHASKGPKNICIDLSKT